LAFGLGLAFAVSLTLGLVLTSCGPKQKFCPDAGDGVCRPILDSGLIDTYVAPPAKDGATYIGEDGGT
jgi:hypothetical protein